MNAVSNLAPRYRYSPSTERLGRRTPASRVPCARAQVPGSYSQDEALGPNEDIECPVRSEAASSGPLTAFDGLKGAIEGNPSSNGRGVCKRGILIGFTAGAIGMMGVTVEPAAAADIESVMETITRDFIDKQYYTTGNLTASAYEPDCQFIDPTTNVKGVTPYTNAVASLFDPEQSRADLIDIHMEDASTIVLRWRLEGALRFGGLRIKPYTGTTRYTINSKGLITKHEETWDISAADAFLSTVLPGFGAPPAPPIQELIQK